MVKIGIPKNRILIKKLQILYFFLLKKDAGRWDNININKHSGDCIEFIIGTISYDKYCTIKLSFLDMPIVDYLDITITLISSDLMKPSVIIQILSMHINFLSFLRNTKRKFDFFFW